MLTAWNGMMITTLALAGDALGEERYLLAARTLGAVDYPEPQVVTLGFQAEPLAVFQGLVTIRATVEREPSEGVGVAAVGLGIQACDEERCLRPEELTLEIPAPRKAAAGPTR